MPESITKLSKTSRDKQKKRNARKGGGAPGHLLSEGTSPIRFELVQEAFRQEGAKDAALSDGEGGAQCGVLNALEVLLVVRRLHHHNTITLHHRRNPPLELLQNAGVLFYVQKKSYFLVLIFGC